MFNGRFLVSISAAVGLMVCIGELGAQSQRDVAIYQSFRRYQQFQRVAQRAPLKPHWMADGSSFWYSEGSPANTIIWKVNPKANQQERKTQLFDTMRLRDKVKTAIGQEPPGTGVPFHSFVFEDDTERTLRFTVRDQEFTLDLDDCELKKAPPVDNEQEERPMARQEPQPVPGWEFPRYQEELSPNGLWFLGIQGRNLYVRSTKDDSRFPLTSDGVEDNGWGGNFHAKFAGAAFAVGKWSPDGSKVVATKVDYRGVPKIPITRYRDSEHKVDWWPHAGARDARPKIQLSIFDIHSRKQTPLDAGGKTDGFIETLGWSLDRRELLFRRTSRYGVKREFMAANVKDGSTRVILNETDFGKMSEFKLLEDGERFICVSDLKESMEGQLWSRKIDLFNLDGTHVVRLVDAVAGQVQVVAVDERLQQVYFTTSLYDGGDHGELWRVGFDGEGLTLINDTPGSHHISFSPSKEYYVDTSSTPSTPPLTPLRRTDGKPVMTLDRVNIDDAIQKFGWLPPETFVVEAADGKTQLRGILWKPYDFDDKKKYPVVTDGFGFGVFGVPNSFAEASVNSMAVFGFVVVKVQTRFTHGEVGRDEIADHVAALHQVAKTRPYMDLNRVGIVGGSYGGYMVLHAMLTRPDVFHVGVAGAPINDMAEHGGNEGLIGPPEKNANAYKYVSNESRAANLRGKLLLIHGTSDRQVPFFHTMRLVNAFRRAGKQCDMYIIPEGNHATKDVYRGGHINRYLMGHLQP